MVDTVILIGHAIKPKKNRLRADGKSEVVIDARVADGLVVVGLEVGLVTGAAAVGAVEAATGTVELHADVVALDTGNVIRGALSSELA